MTDGNKQIIAHLCRRGMGYTEIARKLGLSANTVKSYCRRNGLKRTVQRIQTETHSVCRQCGSTLNHTSGRKRKQFCSDACRLRWWHEHRDMSRTAKVMKCAACGREFITDRVQKYCSHACYIEARFGGAHGNETYLGAV